MIRHHQSRAIYKLYASRFLLMMMIVIISTIASVAQDIEKVLEQKPLTVSGGISANTTFYEAFGIDRRRDPFYWQLNANLNFNILGIIQAPFSMTISQQDKSFSQPQPFNRFGISPKYKMVTGHFGHRTMTFSEYTLAGNMFLGAGVEVVPESSFVRVSAMYGQLAKAVERSAQEGLVFAKPTYRRMGYGVKVGLGRKKHMVDLILFRAADDEHSIQVTDELDVTPEENLVGAIHSRHEINDRINVEWEYAYSLFTRDKRVIATGEENYSFLNNLGGLFAPNMSSEFNNAFTTTVNYNGSWYQTNVKYRSIDPGYRTLGSSFLNNGLKDITGGVSWNMLKQKINIATNAGFQKTEKEDAVVRIIYSLNINYNSTKRLVVNTNFANFSTSTRQTQIQRDILIDTLEYFQVTRNAAVNANYKIGNEKYARTLVLSATMQDATDSDKNSSTFYSFTAGHQMKVATHWQLGVSAAFNKNYSRDFENTSAGPVLNLNRSFSQGKFRTALAAAFLNSYMGDSMQSRVTNASITNTLRVKKKHSFALNSYYLKSEQQDEQGKTFSEVRVMVNYNYSF